MVADVAALCEQWIAQDKNERTREEIRALRDAGNVQELSARLSKRIGFGTAGLRARMEAGFGRMNDLTVIQASQGLCAYVISQDGGARERGVVVGHDHRHNSARFARLTTGVFLRAGFKVYLLNGLSCTPLVPFSVGRLKAAAGVMITASHNPAMDNGYKVYCKVPTHLTRIRLSGLHAAGGFAEAHSTGSNAVQIVPPHDTGIAESIGSHLDVPDEAWTPDEIIERSPLCIQQTEQLVQEYIKTLAELCKDPGSISSSDLEIVYTPMHGVGLPYAKSILSAFNFSSAKLHVVPSQANPDPDFPTVKFPNPEEKGALDAAISHANNLGVNLIVANDPDADRFCAAERADGAWKVFTGDQMGVMLGVHLFQDYAKAGKPLNKLAMLASTVSSKMLAVVAEKEGFHFEDTLTGFKWLGNGALNLEKKGYAPIFAYEEAIGYMVSPHIRDKDGISALAVFVSLARSLRNAGQTLTGYLESLYAEYGQFSTLNSYWICRDSSKMSRIFDSLRVSSSRGGYPDHLGEWRIASLRDITKGYDSSESDGRLRALPRDPSGQMLQFELEIGEEHRSKDGIAGLVGTIRTSGTEPKCKYYLEGWGRDRRKVDAALIRVRNAIAQQWLRVHEEGLEGPA